MKRRDFIKLSALGSAGAFLLNGHAANTFSSHYLLNSFDCNLVNDRCIVLVQLSGGNDGLNTIVPANQYDTYAELRPIIKLNDIGESNGLISLDTTLSLDDQIGLNPSLSGFKSLYEAGKLNIVQGVSYPDHNKSHFKSTDNLLKGIDGTSNSQSITTGWMSRFLENQFDFSQFEDPLGIQLGSQKPSVGFHTEAEHRVDINISGQDPSGYYTLISQIGTAPIPNTPSSDYGDNLEFIMNMENNVNTYAERITNVFNNGSNIATYPDTKLADQLKTVARLINGGSKTKIFLVSLSGFDTHNSQISGDGSHLGKHADLLSELSEAMVAFQSDLGSLGLEDRVLSATFSEFGRKAKENGNYGTDHGKIAPLFVFGKHVKAGVTGGNMDLSLVGEDGQLEGVQHDYRQVFTTLIQDWMGGSNGILEQSNFSEFEEEKLAIIDSEQVVPEDCYQSPIGIVELNLDIKFSAYPNPAKAFTIIEINVSKPGAYNCELFNINGVVVRTYDWYLLAGDFSQEIDLSGLEAGNYIGSLTDEAASIKKEMKLLIL